MKIAITGKGGVGKTTIAGTLARLLGRQQQRVLALDGDSNPNLAHTLGIPRANIAALPAVPMGLTEWREDAAGHAYVHLRQPVAQFIANFGISAPDGVQLILTGEVEKASAGCRCEAHAVARGITGHLVSEADVAVLDMEAGLEHLGRGTAEHVDVLLIVTEPYFRSLEAASRIRELAAQLELPHILAVANRVRTKQDEAAIRQYCGNHGLELAAVIPFDEAAVHAEMNGQALIDYAPDSPAVQAVATLVSILQSQVG
ncbi:MAG: Light-independent protochlorophyllide reductase iron-sulfur ATP-binding protein [Anaerolineae bacterium]|nr:Light-independent protochlorophyllide reductase iron-sulfur ATP-binding protein [Anaerolineae bacterium]